MMYDFGGYATRNDLKCSDGLTIRKGAFAHCDGRKVPLVYNHDHNSISNVVGYAVLENRSDGVYCYGSFNDTPNGEYAREQVKHGDIEALSIFANRLKKNGKDVMHGEIREVSLVLAGANPGAYIDVLSVEHAEDEDYEDGEAIIYNDDVIEHKMTITIQDTDGDGIPDNVDPTPKGETSDDNSGEDNTESTEKTLQDVIDTFNPEQKAAFEQAINVIIEQYQNGGYDEDEYEDEDEAIEHSDKSLQDVIDTFNPEQKAAFEQTINAIIEQYQNGDFYDEEDEDDSDDEVIEHSEGETIGEVIDSLSPKQRAAVEVLIGMAIDMKSSSVSHSEIEPTNLFDKTDSKQCTINYDELFY